MKTRIALFLTLGFCVAVIDYLMQAMVYPILTEQVAVQQFKYDGTMHGTRLLSRSYHTVEFILAIVAVGAGVLLFTGPITRWIRSLQHEEKSEDTNPN